MYSRMLPLSPVSIPQLYCRHSPRITTVCEQPFGKNISFYRNYIGPSVKLIIEPQHMTLHINSFMEQAQTNPAIKQMNVDNKMNLSFQTYSYISPLNKHLLQTGIGIIQKLGNGSCHCEDKSWVREWNIIFYTTQWSKLISAYVT
jgi:hypothetical protein